MNEITALIKETPVSPFYPCENAARRQLLMSQELGSLHTKSSQHLERGLAASITVRVMWLIRLPVCGILLVAQTGWKQLFYP